jgi:hypothetical protein
VGRNRLGGRMGNVMIPEDVATLAGGPEPIGPPGAPPMAPAGPPPGMDPMGAPPPGGGGLPPELAGLLGGGPEGAPPGGPPPEEAGGEGGSEVDILSQALETLMEYLTVASDDIEKAKAMKAAGIVQELLASNQKEQETAAGIGPAQRGMRKALAGP